MNHPTRSNLVIALCLSFAMAGSSLYLALGGCRACDSQTLFVPTISVLLAWTGTLFGSFGVGVSLYSLFVENAGRLWRFFSSMLVFGSLAAVPLLTVQLLSGICLLCGIYWVSHVSLLALTIRWAHRDLWVSALSAQGVLSAAALTMLITPSYRAEAKSALANLRTAFVAQQGLRDSVGLPMSAVMPEALASLDVSGRVLFIPQCIPCSLDMAAHELKASDGETTILLLDDPADFTVPTNSRIIKVSKGVFEACGVLADGRPHVLIVEDGRVRASYVAGTRGFLQNPMEEK